MQQRVDNGAMGGGMASHPAELQRSIGLAHRSTQQRSSEQSSTPQSSTPPMAVEGVGVVATRPALSRAATYHVSNSSAPAPLARDRLRNAIQRDQRLSSAAWTGPPSHRTTVLAALAQPGSRAAPQMLSSCPELASLHDGLNSLQRQMLQRRQSAASIAKDVSRSAGAAGASGSSAPASRRRRCAPSQASSGKGLQWHGTRSYLDEAGCKC